MLSLFVRNFIFTILQPGIVAGFIPYLILGENFKRLFTHQIYSFGFHTFGVVIILIGMVIMFSCIVNFAVEGKGTLSPIDQTKKLVSSRFYKFSRNPMYVGVILILIGQALFFQSTDLLIYSLFIFIVFNTFVIFVEEPRLRKHFGNEYLKYCEKVRRWI